MINFDIHQSTENRNLEAFMGQLDQFASQNDAGQTFLHVLAGVQDKEFTLSVFNLCKVYIQENKIDFYNLILTRDVLSQSPIEIVLRNDNVDFVQGLALIGCHLLDFVSPKFAISLILKCGSRGVFDTLWEPRLLETLQNLSELEAIAMTFDTMDIYCRIKGVGSNTLQYLAYRQLSHKDFKKLNEYDVGASDDLQLLENTEQSRRLCRELNSKFSRK